MGGVAVTLPLQQAAKSDDACKELQRALWSRVRRRIESWLKKKSSWDIIGYYLSDFESDGFRKGDWSSDEQAMWFVFGDAAGLCYREMYCSEHWATLALLDSFEELQALAQQHGAQLKSPTTALAATALVEGKIEQVMFEGKAAPELRAMLGDGREHVFFHVGTKLAMGQHNPAPNDDYTFTVLGPEEVPLAKLAAGDRERVRDLVTRGLCACEPCQVLRRKYDLPLAPEPKRAPAKAKAPQKDLPPPPVANMRWEDAEVLTRPDIKVLKANPAAAVALDLSAPNQYEKVSPAVLRALPSLPVQVLGLRNHGLRALPAEIPKLKDLEILSLKGCSLKAPLGDSLQPLDKLRALDLRGNLYDGLLKDVRLPRSLEAIDLHNWKGELPADVLAMNKLRHIDLSGATTIPHALGELPIESVLAHAKQAIDPGMLRAWPLRYLQTSDAAVPALGSLEMLKIGNVLPDGLQQLPKLRALYIWSDDIKSLPDWLAELPIEMLALATRGLKDNPGGFKVIERMRKLRVLSLLPQGASSLPLDLSALTSLEVLAITNFEAETWAAFPRGIDGLRTLRRFFYTTGRMSDAERDQLKAAVPGAESDPNALRCLAPVAFYRAMLPKTAPERMLSRLSEAYWIDDLFA